MTFRQRLDVIAKQKEQLRSQEAEFEAERSAALAALPDRFGYQDLPSFIRAVGWANRKMAVKPSKRSKSKAPEPQAPRGLARAQVAQEVMSAPASAGTSLDDPANFGQMPDFSLLGNGQAVSQEDRSRLSDAYAFATRVLHTSRVPAAVWREWRRFEKEAAELLRR